jgi:hypothetical protein
MRRFNRITHYGNPTLPTSNKDYDRFEDIGELLVTIRAKTGN